MLRSLSLAPEGIVKAMELLGVKKAVYIGDNITDIQAGKKCWY